MGASARRHGLRLNDETTTGLAHTHRVVLLSLGLQVPQTVALAAAAAVTGSSALFAQTFAAIADLAVQIFLAIGVRASSEWLARDHDGFILTGTAANTNNLLETAVPGVFAAGDVRSGSTKRCATAVGEGSMAVQFVHAHLTRTAYVEGAR